MKTCKYCNKIFKDDPAILQFFCSYLCFLNFKRVANGIEPIESILNTIIIQRVINLNKITIKKDKPI